MKPFALAGLAVVALGSSACAEVYIPRPSGAVVITSNGGSGYRVFKNGEDMGSEWAVGDAVAGDPKAEAQADKASSERVGAIVSNIGGAIAWGAGWTMFGIDASNNANNFPTTLGDAGLGLIIGGAALYILGGALQGAAHTHMFNAVNIYNDDLAARAGKVREVPVIGLPPGYLPPPPPAGQGVYVTPGPGYAPRPVAPAPLVAPPAPAPVELAPPPPY